MKFFILAAFALCSVISPYCQGVYSESFEKTEIKEDLEQNSSFYISDISPELFEKMRGKSFKEDCTIPLSDLRYVHVLHKNLEGKTLEGELVCNVVIAEILLKIFYDLYKASYPIEKIRLIDEYDGDDEMSMRDNNSSCFNFRFISHSNKVSMHGEGLAVDINPLYNPCCKRLDGKVLVEPASAVQYVDRSKDFPYKIDHNDLAYKLFTEAGFVWGGDWSSLKDWQHFEWNQN